MEQQLNDDSSHYEISLTAGQAFVAFVLLLLSLAASFAFGIMVGRGQGPTDVATSTPESTVITEKASTVDVPEVAPATAEPEVTAPAREESSQNDFVIEPAKSAEPARTPAPTPVTPTPASTPAAAPSEAPVPHFAQLLSTADQKTAEALAARLIDDGFTTAYVERTQGDAGMIHRVRVRFPSEAAARAAVPKLQRYTKEEIWVTRQQ
jgi:cell division septation protein DedD